MKSWGSKDWFCYRVYTDVDRNQYATFDNIVDAQNYAKAHDTVVWVSTKEDFDSLRKYRGQNVVISLATLFVLSMIGWGWIVVLCGVGLI